MIKVVLNYNMKKWIGPTVSQLENQLGPIHSNHKIGSTLFLPIKEFGLDFKLRIKIELNFLLYLNMILYIKSY